MQCFPLVSICNSSLRVIPDWQAAFSHSQVYAEGELMQYVAAAIQPLTDHASVVRVVRQIRHREMARIAWRDLSGMADWRKLTRYIRRGGCVNRCRFCSGVTRN